jgi:adenylate cyclase
MLRFLRVPFRWSSSYPQALLAGVFVAALGAELFVTHFLSTTEYRLADVLMVQQADSYVADPDIVIIDVDEKSVAAMQDVAGLWPWPREIHADLLAGLMEFQPRAIVFDIAFPEHDTRRPKSDAMLSETISGMQNVYLPATHLSLQADTEGVKLAQVAPAFGNVRRGAADARAALQLPNAIDPAGWRLGLINSSPDADGVLRRYRTRLTSEGWRLPSLPARVAGDLGAKVPEDETFMMRWPARGHVRLPYNDTFRRLTELRSSLGAAALADMRKQLEGKIVVIGVSAASAFDHFVTPLGAGYPGADVLATAIDNLKNGRSVHVVGHAAALAFGAALILLLAFAFSRRMHPLAIGGGLVCVTIASLATTGVALGRDVWLPLSTPLIFAWALYFIRAIEGYLRERRAREQAVSLFGRFLNPAVVRQIVDQGQTVESLSGRNCTLTVLFSDIRGFTTLSETRAPQDVVALLNRHFERQVEVVFRHGGTLDKFIGDCIMAFWGAPLDDPDHARNAVAAALEMQEALLAFKQELIDSGADVGDFDVGIGVHSGPAVVGFIGARRKLDYTAIGDTVNLASRVEGLTKGVARVLVTRDTMEACMSSASKDYTFTPRGSFAVKGRAAQVELYEPRRDTQ